VCLGLLVYTIANQCGGVAGRRDTRFLMLPIVLNNGAPELDSGCTLSAMATDRQWLLSKE